MITDSWSGVVGRTGADGMALARVSGRDVLEEGGGSEGGGGGGGAPARVSQYFQYRGGGASQQEIFAMGYFEAGLFRMQS